MKPDPYASAGVNVPLGDAFSSYCGGVCHRSWRNSHFVEVTDLTSGHFRGPRGFQFVNLPKGSIMTAGADGVGTKHVVIDAAGRHHTTADNLLAMCGGDITRYGGIPLVFMNILDLASLGKAIKDDATYAAAQSLMDGLAKSAREQHYVLLGGETAELPGCVTSENPEATLNCLWGGFMIGAYHPSKMILGNQMRPGDRVVALRDVCRSNGISLLRKWLAQELGPKWWQHSDNEFVQEIAAPAALYERFLVEMHGWTREGFSPLVQMNGIANISGGGILGKFGDLIFQYGLSAHLDNLWGPPGVMSLCARSMDLDDKSCYGTWCCGNGTLVVVPENAVETFIGHASGYDIEARDAGRIEEIVEGSLPSITIRSGFTGDEFTHHCK